MIVEFLEEAEQELMDAVLWYESKEAGLGKHLRNEIAHVLDRILIDESTVPFFLIISPTSSGSTK